MTSAMTGAGIPKSGVSAGLRMSMGK
jgi:hypothetical protein